MVGGQKYPVKTTFKEARPKKYRSFKITKNIEQDQFELPEKQAMHNMFYEDLLTQCKKLQLKGQYINTVLPSDIINEKEEYKVEEVQNHRK